MNGRLFHLLVLVICIFNTYASFDVKFISSPEQMAFFVPHTTRNLLFTFDPSVTCNHLLNSQMADNLCPNGKLRLSTVPPLSVHEMGSLQSVLNLHNVSLHCGSEVFPLIRAQYAPIVQRIKAAPTATERRELIGLVKTSPEREYPYSSAQICADALSGDLGYALNFIANHWGPLHPFPVYSGVGYDTGLYHLGTGQRLQMTNVFTAEQLADDANEVRMAVAADWGAGTMESAYVADLLVAGFDPHYTIHIGDVYYVGTVDEIKSNCLGIPPVGVKQGVLWPKGSTGSLALQGNHEMYARGYGYFDNFLPVLGFKNQTTGEYSGQKASFSELENQYWRIINLDTGFHSYDSGRDLKIDNDNNTQPQQIIDWLVNVVNITNPDDMRGIIFLSHHQYFSAFEPPSLATPTQLSELLPPGRQVLWFWGHEHRLAFYDLHSAVNISLNAWGRCVGNSGYPTTIDAEPSYGRESYLSAFDDRFYELEVGLTKIPVGFNGWAQLVFDRNMLNVTYSSLSLDQYGNVSSTVATPLITELFVVDENSGDVLLKDFVVLNSNMTIVKHE